MNRYKGAEDIKDESEEKKETGSLGRSLVRFLNGSFLTREEVLARLPYFFFLAFLMVCYIGYGYYTQKTMKELYRVREEVEELRSEYITTKSELMFKSKRSEVVEATKRIGLEESTEPPEKIVVEQKGR
jgi:hypothetical protein